jgi:hypothetical protein
MPRELSSLICDDIRFEQGNKVSLMGVYTDGILVSGLPFIFPRLCLFQLLDDCQHVRKIKVALRGPKLNVPPVEFEATTGGKSKVRAIITFTNVKFEEEADYEFDVSFDDDKASTITKKFYVKVEPSLKIQ